MVVGRAVIQAYQKAIQSQNSKSFLVFFLFSEFRNSMVTARQDCSFSQEVVCGSGTLILILNLCEN
jgi:hypothetical protein